MKNNKQRIGAEELDFEVVDLYKSESNKSATSVLHFDTEDTNQFCDFTEAVLEIVSKIYSLISEAKLSSSLKSRSRMSEGIST